MSTAPSPSTQPSTVKEKPTTPPAVSVADPPKPTLSSWSQAETASSQSAQRTNPPGEETKVFSWADIKSIISTNRLDVIRRQPSTRLVYKAWCKETIATYGSITAYMIASRLKWTPRPDTSSSTGPVFEYNDPTSFADPNDFRILPNDWPYGSFGPEITHLIVWSKPRIATDPETGFVMAEGKEMIDAFGERTFVKRLELEGDAEAGERVLWFKNWIALQSVHGLERIHVLVRDVPERFHGSENA
ncbi:MAG: hypothetical protein Q9221_002362 [Calogaya cf. arnoldii]